MMTARFWILLGAGLVLATAAPGLANAGVRQACSPAAGALLSALLSRESADELELRELALRFEQADSDKSASLTLDEARRAGFGFVAAHFRLIDTRQRGAISFDELMDFMRRMRRQTGAKQG